MADMRYYVHCTIDTGGVVTVVRDCTAATARALAIAAQGLDCCHVSWDGPHDSIDPSGAFEMISDLQMAASGDLVAGDHVEIRAGEMLGTIGTIAEIWPHGAASVRVHVGGAWRDLAYAIGDLRFVGVGR